MTRQQTYIYPVTPARFDLTETTEDEDLVARQTFRRRRQLPDPHTAQARRWIEAAVLTAAVLTWSLFALTHGPRGTAIPPRTQAVTAPQDSSRITARMGRGVVATDQKDWTVQRAGERGENHAQKTSPTVPAYQADWAEQRTGERAAHATSARPKSSRGDRRP